ncbi:MAG TPA: 30S ribosomal protein S3 [Candidatus Sumerlaeota bacterium]|nr:30S ribosomal protein S3 [Candidatus Sumerlaeota bacterium]
MGQKIHPYGLRLGIIRDWQSRSFIPRNYKETLHEDLKIRKMIKGEFNHAGVAAIEIERATKRAKVTIHTSRPGIVIGKKGESIERLRKTLEKMTDKQIVINIEEVKRPDLSAQLVAENVAGQLLRRIGFRRAMKKTVQSCMKAGALGVKIQCSGRLGGAEMSRMEKYREGRVPLHTLRADIDYGLAEANTKYGIIGVKAWVFRGEVFDKTKKAAA